MPKTLILGSHVDMNKKNDYLLGSVRQAVAEGANTFMIFTGPPQSSIRTEVEKLNIDEFKQECIKNNIDLNNLLVHAPYIVNLANPIKKDVVNFSIDFLTKEIKRVLKIGIKKVVLHPGAAVGGDRLDALKTLVNSLDTVLDNFMDDEIFIALETMSGKGTEVCINFDEMAYVLNNVKHKNKLGVCMDTCHVFDGGYDIKNNFQDVINEFKKKIGIEKLLAIHLNDSKNVMGSKKDRHENIGYGNIGFAALASIVHHSDLIGIPIFLETPYVNDKSPYELEIKMLRENKFIDFKNIL